MKESIFSKINNKFKKMLGYIVWMLVIFLIISTVGNLKKVERIKEEIEREKVRIAKIEAENRELEEAIALAKSSEFIEEEIRNKLGLVKSGEVVVVLPDEETLRKLAPEIREEEDILPDPNWKKWLKLFSS